MAFLAYFQLLRWPTLVTVGASLTFAVPLLLIARVSGFTSLSHLSFVHSWLVLWFPFFAGMDSGCIAGETMHQRFNWTLPGCPPLPRGDGNVWP